MGTRNTKSEPINTLHYRYKKGELKIPSVQRELVWTTSQKQLLVDSLFKDYDIPKIYFRDIVEDGKHVFHIIDGQQRINAIMDFIDNKYPMSKDADSFDGESMAGKTYNELSTDLQIAFTSRSLDVVHLVDYTDEEIDETFLRLQNGTPLKAAEKRRAIPGNMRDVVHELSSANFFIKHCDFDNSHYNFEDITTKVLKQISEGACSISAQALSKFYEHNSKVSIQDSNCKRVKSAFNFLDKAFSKVSASPHLKKYSAMDLSIIANNMLTTYDLNSYQKQFAEVYLNFLNEKAQNSEKKEDEQDPKLQAYNNATRGDSLEFIQYRQNMLQGYFIENMPYLEVKDTKRDFTPEQRAAIYRLGFGICAKCGKKVDENEDFHADHIKPYSKGGKTQISNGQLLCADCNLKKSNKYLD